ncbi:class I SAM-dependent methyltransferase [Dyadobacter aurulentus]|uniref:class I SAM-dependent methyltransferase n=1 Tax=Dyadobacter sp. UC 10 TaxID=2605428 RepID=UPI0011F1FDCD|nr:class I SAM-dependent methyltransferase [Dyadobacter sp. UC 10]KAA0992346.1 class I SAM-dependent methyltransferase [Dyadobacter sp. UC 10]
MESNRENWIVSYPDDGNSVCYEMEDMSFWYQHRNECLVQAMKANDFPAQFYDIGGGNGITAQAMQNAGYEVTLLEPYRAGIDNAIKRGIKKTIHSTLEAYLPEAPGTVPAAGFFDVMEHIEDDHAFLKQINSLLEENGLIMLTVPAFQSLWSDNDEQLGHFRRYDLKQLERKLALAGFKIQYKSYFFSLVWLPMWLMRVLPNRLGKRKVNTPQKKKSEHMAGSPSTSRFLRSLLHWEIGAIRNKHIIPFGTSCLVIAKKTISL